MLSGARKTLKALTCSKLELLHGGFIAALAAAQPKTVALFVRSGASDDRAPPELIADADRNANVLCSHSLISSSEIGVWLGPLSVHSALRPVPILSPIPFAATSYLFFRF
jgi:hypothetical protein